MNRLEEALPEFLGRQRWFAGHDARDAAIVDRAELDDRLEWLLVEAGGARYSLLVGRSKGPTPEFLHGHDDAFLGLFDDELLYDAVHDADLMKALLSRFAPDHDVERMRPMGAEQSNTSLVFDDRLVLKVFRRVQAGLNPDIEVTGALADAGFAHVAAPLATWERGGTHLAVLQPFLAGGIDGWALALTSLRDLYGNDCADPADCGGDFAAESRRLGAVTAQMHVALAAAFGTREPEVDQWVGLMERQLERVGAEAPWRDGATAVFERFRGLTRPGPAIRVHGDYHLGQVLRTDVGWFVLDFEGEPARPLDERRALSSPLKDVAGMLRSFHYAAAVALRDRPEDEWEVLAPLGSAWEQRNRGAFLDGYLESDGIDELLPPDQADVAAALAAWELDKAIYEVAYERDHRPDWVEIPETAISRLLEG